MIQGLFLFGMCFLAGILVAVSIGWYANRNAFVIKEGGILDMNEQLYEFVIGRIIRTKRGTSINSVHRIEMFTDDPFRTMKVIETEFPGWCPVAFKNNVAGYSFITNATYTVISEETGEETH